MPKNAYETSSGLVTHTRAGIERHATDDWIELIGMEDMEWDPADYTFRFERTILGIDSNSNTIKIDIPIVMSLDSEFPPAKIFELKYKEEMISDVGIENMCLESDYDENDPDDESHAWYAVVLDNVHNGWVADVTTKHFVCGIFASNWSRYITIQDCSVLEPISKSDSGDGLRRYAFNLSGQMGLVKRWRVCGPNAFVESKGEDATNDTGPHERWAMGTLYDNIICEKINVQNRGHMGTGHGWAGVYQVVYNCTAKAKSIIRNAPRTKNWVIGFNGSLDDRPSNEDIGIKAASFAPNATVKPRSLYWSQLIERMGGDSDLVKRTV
ncbi:hypothetical protein BG005_002122, partial [Podila minutissima]